MKNPFATFDSIRDFYITYLETAFRIGDANVQLDRRRLLESIGTLCTEPFIEPLPKFKKSGVRIDDLCKPEVGDQWLPRLDSRAREIFVKLAMAGLIEAETDSTGRRRGTFDLYSHQLTMLLRGTQSGMPGIVTSGTGSGKTEAFLLPILATICQEAAKWPSSQGVRQWRPWWRVADAGDRPKNWKDFKRRSGGSAESLVTFPRDLEPEGRPKAVRALILYPMNALVEDQLVRLRRALDSDAAHKAMDEDLRGNRIHFARYTSATSVTGWLRHPRLYNAQDRRVRVRERRRVARRIADLWNSLQSADQTYQAALEEIAAARRENRPVDEQLPFNFPRVPGAEIFSRWEIQRHPPDLLITNTSMLSAMLVREVDEPIWTKTREWLESNDDAYFFLVLDELHLQRGTSGTEVAFLLRVLLERLGLDRPKHRHKLRILSSSASLPMDDPSRGQSLSYLWDMFGTNGLGENKTRQSWESAVVIGERSTEKITEAVTPIIDDFVNLASRVFSEDGDVIVPPSKASKEWLALARSLGTDAKELTEDIFRLLVEKAGQLLERGCTDDHGVRAAALSVVATRLFGPHPRAQSAVRALASIRTIADSWSDYYGRKFESSVSSFRIHAFLRAIEGLFAAPCAPANGANREALMKAYVSDLSVERGLRLGRSTETGQRSRFLELLYCECCGSLFFGGMRGATSTDSSVELLPNDPDPENLPERAKSQMFEDLSSEQFAIFLPTVERFWPVGEEDLSIEHAQGIWRPSLLNPITGSVRPFRAGDESKGGIRGHLYIPLATPDAWQIQAGLRRYGTSVLALRKQPNCSLVSCSGI
jgi:DEAD/DEAH box helicase domain-containing protein